MTPTATPIYHVWSWKKNSKKYPLGECLTIFEAISSTKLFSQKVPFSFHFGSALTHWWTDSNKHVKVNHIQTTLSTVFSLIGRLEKKLAGSCFQWRIPWPVEKRSTIMNTLWSILKEDSLKKSSLNHLKKNHRVEHIHRWSFKEKHHCLEQFPLRLRWLKNSKANGHLEECFIM